MEDPATMADTEPDTWETVCVPIPGQDITERIAVPNGWVYRTRLYAGATTGAAGQISVALTFVPEIDWLKAEAKAQAK